MTSHPHRSHAVLQVTVEASRIAVGTQQEVQTGRLYMVDLAGSERAAQTQVMLVQLVNLFNNLLCTSRIVVGVWWRELISIDHCWHLAIALMPWWAIIKIIMLIIVIVSLPDY